ncbi:MAG: choice-of-anchor X domain-containing protein [Promethearchaeota archaeon]
MMAIFSFMLSSLLLLSFNQTVKAVEDFNPDPVPPGIGPEYWDFNENDIVGWHLGMYINGSFMFGEDYIFNISDCTYKLGNSYQGYFVELTKMYWNASINGLQIDPYHPLVNASGTNFTYNVITASDSYFYIPPFIHNNGTALAQHWCGQAYQNSTLINAYIPNSQLTIKGNNTWINSTTTNSFMHAIYNNHGIMEFGEFFIDYEGLGMGTNKNQSFVYTRIYDFNPLNEISWGVEIGDLLYYNQMMFHNRFEVTDIVNVTDEEGRSVQRVIANISNWDRDNEVWIYDDTGIIGEANDYLCNLNYLITKEAEMADLISTFSNAYDNITYGTDWIQAENTTTPHSLFLHYFSNGILRYYKYHTESGENIFYYKNASSLSSGIYNISFDPYKLKNRYNISIGIEVNDNSEFFFAGVPDNPVGITLFYGDLFIDLMLNESLNIVGKVNLTIEYDTNFEGPFALWYFNVSSDMWESVPLDDNSFGTLNATLEHLSLYGLTRGKPPGSFSLSSTADTPDKDGIFNLTWTLPSDAINYSIYQYSNYITEINGSITRLAEGVSDLFYTITGLSNGTYYYKVLALNPYGNSTTNCIQIDVSLGPPGNFILSSNAENPDNDGFYSLTWNRSNGAINYTIYEYTSYITEINETVNILAEGYTSRNYPINFQLDGTYYYKVLGFNKYGNSSTNSIRIDVQKIFISNYTMELNTSYNWIDTVGATNLGIGDDDYFNRTLPFEFTFYGENYSSILIGSNGWVSFYEYDDWFANIFPDTDYKRQIAIFAEDLDPSSSLGQVYIRNLTAPNRYAIIWNNIDLYGAGNAGTFEIILYENGLIKLQYQVINDAASAYCGINRGEGANYYNYYDNLNNSISSYAIDFIPFVNNLPELTQGQVQPTSGDQNTLYTFTVNYTDLDNDVPAYINVVINGTDYTMSKQNSSDTDFTDGCIYNYSTYLEADPYNYTYYFECHDGRAYNNTLTYDNLEVIQSYLILNWTSVFPPSSIIGTEFNITAELSAFWGLQSVYAKIHYNNGTVRSYLMYDDGLHGDNQTGDGIYGMFWNSTNQLIGTYNISINATDNSGYHIVFSNVTSFNVTATDSDAPILLMSQLSLFLADANFNNSFIINCNLWDVSDISNITAYIRYLNGTLLDIVALYDDGNHNDKNPDDNKFGNTWYSNYSKAGFYYIDIYCNDSYSNSIIYYNELNFILLDWNISIDETIIYNVTYNNLSPFLNPLSHMTTGTIYRFDLKDIFSYYLSELGDDVWRIIGNAYQLNDTIFFELLNSLKTLVDANISLTYYKDYFFADEPNFILATLIPTPVCNWTFKWLEDSDVFETFFPDAAYTYVYTDTSINIFLTNNPDDINLTIDYNNHGIMTRYYLEYYGDLFEMVLILNEVVKNNGSFSNPNITFITDNYLNFTIIYTNTKNIPPICVNVTINGQVYNMLHSDYNYTDGSIFYYQIILPDGLYHYNYSYYDGNYVDYTSTKNILVGLHYPTLTDGYFAPLSGNQSTLITFFVNYTDADNNASVYVRVVIDGNPYDMQQQDPLDLDYTNGCIFNKTLILDGNYSYYFICSDGLVSTNTSIEVGPIIEVKNLTPPTLTDQNVDPNPGELSVQDIYFNVTYTDAENNAPEIIVLTLDGVNYTMLKQDPSDFDCTDGCVYYYIVKIHFLGLHEYNFTAWDGLYWVYLSTFTVSIIQTNPPTLSNADVTPKNGQYGVTLINFTVTYTDINNDAPSYVYVQIGGTNYTMNKAFGSDNDYTDGCLYYYEKKMLDVGNITYRFWASDGLYLSGNGPYNNLEIHAAPILSVAYQWDHVYPNDGEVLITNFRFDVKYTDYDNDAPTFINITINSQNYTLSKKYPSDNNYVDGVIYQLYKVFSTTGIFEFNFTTSDGNYIVFIGSWSVDVHLTNAPTLADGKVDPIIGEYGITDFNFTVNYTDIDNHNPSYVRLILEDVSYNMYKLFADSDYTDGCIYYRIIKIERTGILEFNFTAADDYYSAEDGPHFVTVQVSNPPTLSGGQVSPLSGDIHSALFNFSVNYVDLDNTAPTYIYVNIDGTLHSMKKVNDSDVDFTDGCWYYYNSTLDFIGEFTYNFTSSDGLYQAFDGNYLANVIQTTPPTLQNGQVSPLLGEKGITLFNFTVLYTDVDNLAPIYVRITLDGTNYTMVKINPLDNDYTDGCWYYFNTTINVLGFHEYNFSASNSANFIFDGTYSNCLVQAGPELSSGMVSPSIGERTNMIFNFTVLYTHEQNIAPVNINVTIENVDYLMTKVDITDTDYTDGCLYYFTTTLSVLGNQIYNFSAYDGSFTRFYGNFIVQVFPEINWSFTLGQDYIWTIKYSESKPELIGSQWIYTPIDAYLTSMEVSSIYGSLGFMNRTKGYIETIWPYFKIEDYNALTGMYWYYEATYKEYIFFPFVELPMDLYKINESIVEFYFKPEYGLTPTTINIFLVNNSINYEFNYMGTDYRYVFQWNDTGVLEMYKRYENGFMQYHIDTLNASLVDLYDETWIQFEEANVEYVPNQYILGTFNISTSAPFDYVQCATKFEVMDATSNVVINMDRKIFLLNDSYNLILYNFPNMTDLVNYGDYYYKYTMYYYDGSIEIYTTGWQFAFEVEKEIYSTNLGSLNLGASLDWNANSVLGKNLDIPRSFYAKFSFTLNDNFTFVEFNITSIKFDSYFLIIESLNFERFETLYYTSTSSIILRIYNLRSGNYNVSLIADKKCELISFNVSTIHSEIMIEQINFIGVRSTTGFDYFNGLNGTSVQYSVEFNYTIIASQQVLLRIINLTNHAVITETTEFIPASCSISSRVILIMIDFPSNFVDTFVEVNLTLLSLDISDARIIRFRCNETFSEAASLLTVDIIQNVTIYEQTEMTPFFWVEKSLKLVKQSDLTALDVSNLKILELFFDKSGNLDNITIQFDISNKFDIDIFITSYSVCYEVFVFPVIKPTGEIGEKRVEMLIGGESETITIRGVKIRYVGNTPLVDLKIIYRKSLIANILSIGLQKVLPALISPLPTFGLELVALQVMDMIYDIYTQSVSKEELIKFIFRALGSSTGFFLAKHYGFKGTTAEKIASLTDTYHNILDLGFDLISKDSDIIMAVVSAVIGQIWDYLKDNPKVLANLIVQAFTKFGKNIAVDSTKNAVKNAFKVLSIIDILVDAWIKLNAPDEEIKTIYTTFNKPYPGDFTEALLAIDPIIQVNYNGPTIYSTSSLIKLYNILELNMTNIYWNSTHSYLEISALTNINYTGSLQMLFDDPVIRNSLLGIFGPKINSSFFYKNGSLLKIYAYTNLLTFQTFYSINESRVTCSQEFHFDAIQIAENHYRFNYSFNYMENETFIDRIILTLPDGVDWISSNIPYISWIGNKVTWNSNITNLVFEFTIASEEEVDDDKDDDGEKSVSIPPGDFTMLFIIIIIGAVTAIAIIAIKQKSSKSVQQKEFFDKEMQTLPQTFTPSKSKVHKLKETKIPLFILKDVKYKIICDECNKIDFINQENADNFRCPKCGNKEYSFVYICDNCKTTFALTRIEFVSLNTTERLRQKCIKCNYYAKLIQEDEKHPIEEKKTVEVGEVEREEVEREEVEREEVEKRMSNNNNISEALPNDQVQVPTDIKPLKKLYIGVLCPKCQKIEIIPKEFMDTFVCTKCLDNRFHVAYYCPTCQQNYSISREDYEKFNKPKKIECNFCDDEIELVEQ